MFRVQNVCEVMYGHFSQYVTAMEEINAISRARGWTEAKILTPMTGANNRVIVELEYESLEDMQREQDAFYADAEAMKVLRSTAAAVVQGSSASEILMVAPHLA